MMSPAQLGRGQGSKCCCRFHLHCPRLCIAYSGGKMNVHTVSTQQCRMRMRCLFQAVDEHCSHCPCSAPGQSNRDQCHILHGVSYHHIHLAHPMACAGLQRHLHTHTADSRASSKGTHSEKARRAGSTIIWCAVQEASRKRQGTHCNTCALLHCSHTAWPTTQHQRRRVLVGTKCPAPGTMHSTKPPAAPPPSIAPAVCPVLALARCYSPQTADPATSTPRVPCVTCLPTRQTQRQP